MGYFSHDSNAKDDPKIIRLIDQLGLEGYGAFWVLIELLRDQPLFRLPVAAVPRIGRTYNITPAKLTQVITGYDLFEVENEFFFSPSLLRRMGEMKEKYTKRTALGWETRKKNIDNQSNSDAEAMHSNAKNANEIKGKEIKLNERKLKENSKIAFALSPIGSIEGFKKEFLGTQYEQANFEYYHEIIGSWAESKNEKKVNWVAAARNWMARDLKDGKFITQNFIPNGITENKRKPTRSEQLQAGYDATLEYYARRAGDNESFSGEADQGY